MSIIEVSIAEWSRSGPDTDQKLCGICLGDDQEVHAIAERLTCSGMLEVQELARGLNIHSTSFVGTVQLGQVRVTVSPKIEGLPLFRLLKYAYGIRDLYLFETSGYETKHLPFHELLLHQLEVEVNELISRGLKRDYVAHNEHLSSPKGRFDFNQIAAQGGIVRAQIPCHYHQRSENCLHNQVLLAGVKSSLKLTNDIDLRAKLRRKSALLEESISNIPLNFETIRHLERQKSRLSRAYDGAFEIIKVLLAGQGSTLSSDDETIPLPGFLFDMNRFFQRLLVRYFSDWLDGCRIENERVIRGMIDYMPGHNPRNRRSPLPRPDIVILKGRKTMAILDAKYRDLWENPLPREMLYQLAVYSLTGEANSESAILYPTMDSAAREARLEIREPYGAFRGTVKLRPVHLEKLAKLLIERETESAARDKREYARFLAFGDC